MIRSADGGAEAPERYSERVAQQGLGEEFLEGLPQYPDTVRWDPSMVAPVRNYLVGVQPIPFSDLTAGSFAIWLARDSRLSLCRVQGCLGLTFRYTLGGRDDQVWAVVGPSGGTAVAVAFLVGVERQLVALVDDATARQLTADPKVIIEVDESNCDYYLSTSDLRTLDGPKYRRIRADVAQAQRDLPGDWHVAVEAQGAEVPGWFDALSNELLTIERRQDDEGDDRRAVVEGLAFAQLLGTQGLVVRAGRIPVAYFVTRPQETEGFQLVNHIFLVARHRSAMKTAFHHLAAHFEREGVAYLNLEQDLGLPGLREFKRRLRPVQLATRYLARPTGEV